VKENPGARQSPKPAQRQRRHRNHHPNGEALKTGHDIPAHLFRMPKADWLEEAPTQIFHQYVISTAIMGAATVTKIGT